MIKVARGFANGNRKKGPVEFVIGFTPDAMQVLAGTSRVVRPTHVLVAQNYAGATRFYGVECADQRVHYESVAKLREFEPCGFYKIQQRTAPDRKNGGRKQIGADAVQGQINVNASKMPFWDGSPKQLKATTEWAASAGEGFIEVVMPKEIQLSAPFEGNSMFLPLDLVAAYARDHGFSVEYKDGGIFVS